MTQETKVRWSVKQRRSVSAAVLLSFICMSCSFGILAQAPADHSSYPASSVQAEESGVSPSDRIDQSAETSNTILSPSRIVRILGENQELFLEVKSLAEDSSEQSGWFAQTSSISDEQLYQMIGSNKEFRGKVTNFLRARGVVTDEETGSSFPSDESGTYSQFNDGSFPPFEASTLSHNSATLSDRPERAMLGGNQRDYGSQERPTSQLNHLSPHVRSNERSADVDAKTPPNISDAPEVLQKATPYNLLSLRDLYTQLPDHPEHLKRFGSEMFLNRKAASVLPSTNPAGQSFPLDVPLGPDYVLGPGDELSISVWGGASQTFNRMVDRDGSIMLPEAGRQQVAGMTLQKAEASIGGALLPQFRNAKVAVNVARLRSIRIYVVGDVQRPGAYDLSSLSSPLSALYAAGGPTGVGSLRLMRHYRNEQLIGEIDLYDFLLRGIRAADDRLQGGDTLLIPPVGPQVAVYGAVKRPAIYELRNEKTLDTLFMDAGGLTVAASLGHITVDRIVANQHREKISIEASEQDKPEKALAHIAAFEVKDGDRIRVDAVLPASEHVVYVQGHVVRPGKVTYRDGMRLTDILTSYKDLLPEPAARGEVVRLEAPDLHPETISFNVSDVMIGNSNLSLQPFDTVRVFGRYEQDAPNVIVRGEVLRPGSYPLFDGMTAAQLVRAAGGFKRDALLIDADLISYRLLNGTQVVSDRKAVNIGDAVLKEDHAADASLKPGDILTVHQLTGWNDIGASITIEGEVAHPGSYGFQEGEHLSDVLRRAGGFRPTAYPAGAVLTRPEVRVLEEKSREELIRQIETSSAAARLSPQVGGGDQSATLSLIQQQQDQVLSRLRNQPASGRMVIRIHEAIEKWAGTSADIEVRSGDVLRVPKRPGFVLVSGQVYNASAITYVPGKTAGWYLERAGGATQVANRNQIFVIQANGTVIGSHSGGWHERSALAVKLDAGDVIVVPQKIVGASLVWRNLLSVAQIAASLSIAAAVAGL